MKIIILRYPCINPFSSLVNSPFAELADCYGTLFHVFIMLFTYIFPFIYARLHIGFPLYSSLSSMVTSTTSRNRLIAVLRGNNVGRYFQRLPQSTFDSLRYVGNSIPYSDTLCTSAEMALHMQEVRSATLYSAIQQPTSMVPTYEIQIPTLPYNPSVPPYPAIIQTLP
ncbi:hypothetical protein CC80DRAFT_239791 [Byssothecium circinans]|uniref:Uncharacterized protein n=1 Tax=Byssothecium circinans TaxID=147558 RepID=A0A6A5U9K0_9PLEO|nr:hypothetical protein CC80DRAFT_239791 [Byssothecium circinans]